METHFNTYRCAADLAWLLQSAPLLSLQPQHFSAPVQTFSEAQEEAIAHWLEEIDADHLLAYVQQSVPAKANLRLGRYAERLMEYFLRHAGFMALTAANVQLKNTATGLAKDHTTAGEFDYLLHDEQGRPWHWELAVKFYLCHPPASGDTAQGNAVRVQSHDFKGPAGVDTLGLKLNKIFGKQLQHRPPPPFDGTFWQPAAYARGYLFYPYDHAVPHCDDLNPAHERGWWLRQAQFEWAQLGATHFVALPRLQWLGAYTEARYPDGMVLNQRDMAEYLALNWEAAKQENDTKTAQAGVMVAGVAKKLGRWQEVCRGFVLPQV